LEAIRHVREAECEAVGVCLIWSISNPAHELAIGALLDRHLPGVPYTLSHQLNPIGREYRRASATVIDASLKGLMQRHLTELDEDLRAAGFLGELLVATSFGGSWPVEEIIDRPIYAIGSGPSMAPSAGVTYAEAELGEDRTQANLLICDTGGTTFDVSLVREGEVQHSAETWVDGHITGTHSVDVRSLGAGGGSIAWLDAGGLLHVGPESAGADPGPVCYGRGGTKPTVTDAAVALGYIDPDYFLGGRLRLDAAKAEEAVRTQIAEPLGLGTDEAADAIIVVATTNIVGAIREITIAQGIDPRDFVLVAGGGAAGINVVPIARELGCKRVLLPSTAGAFSAVGGLFADAISEFRITQYVETRNLDRGRVNGVLERVGRQAEGFLSRLDSLEPTGKGISYFVDARYPGQVWDIPVPLPSSALRTQADVDAIEDVFHAVHRRLFAVDEPTQFVECLTWKARAVGSLPSPSLPERQGDPARGQDAAERLAYFPEVGRQSVRAVEGSRLGAGTVIAGPAIVTEPLTTIVLYPGSTATVGRFGSYLIDVGEGEEAS
jgi:N-methylhydantoinase A